MSRHEFIDHALAEAQRLRDGILADPDVSPGLIALAVNPQSWEQMYLASLEEAGLLRPEGDLPPIREQPQIISLMATLASGILLGPAGEEILTGDSLTEFFDQVRQWYGDDPGLLAPTGSSDQRLEANVANPIPLIPPYEDYDLGLSRDTYYQALRVYVPWMGWDFDQVLPPDFQISGLSIISEDDFDPLDLRRYLEGRGDSVGLTSLVGPFTAETGGFLPAEERLPFTVHFQNDPVASGHVSEVRVVTQLDSDLQARSFRLGDIKLGDINVHIPSSRSLFQGDFDFVNTKGFILRVSAGIDLKTQTATWLLQPSIL
jgi:hypothetical protein